MPHYPEEKEGARLSGMKKKKEAVREGYDSGKKGTVPAIFRKNGDGKGNLSGEGENLVPQLRVRGKRPITLPSGLERLMGKKGRSWGERRRDKGEPGGVPWTAYSRKLHVRCWRGEGKGPNWLGAKKGSSMSSQKCR